MEFAVGVFERFLNAFDRFNDLQLRNALNIDTGSIADQTHDRLVHALGDVRSDSVSFDQFGQICDFLIGCIFLKDDNHFFTSLYYLVFWTKEKPRLKFFQRGWGKLVIYIS